MKESCGRFGYMFKKQEVNIQIFTAATLGLFTTKWLLPIRTFIFPQESKQVKPWHIWLMKVQIKLKAYAYK